MSNEQSHLHRGISDASGDLAFAPAWVRKDDITPFSLVPGASMQSAAGGTLMIVWVTIEPNRDFPLHQHPHEQAGVMISGAMELTMNGETRLLRPGDGYLIPPHLPHSARTYDEGCVVLDIFSPQREDYARAQQ